DLAVHSATGGGVEKATIKELQRCVKLLGEVLGSAAVIGKGSDCRERVLVAHESAKACLHPPDGDQGSGGYTKGVLDRGKKRSIGGLKRFALRGNCSGTTFCHEGVKRQREALLAAVSRDGPQRITRAHQRRN